MEIGIRKIKQYFVYDLKFDVKVFLNIDFREHFFLILFFKAPIILYAHKLPIDICSKYITKNYRENIIRIFFHPNIQNQIIVEFKIYHQFNKSISLYCGERNIMKALMNN